MVDRVYTDTTDTEQTVNPEADAAAIAAAEAAGIEINGETVAAPEAEPEVAQRPDNVPEKFWNAETGEVNVAAVLKANQELESRFTKQQQSPSEDANTDTSETAQGDEAQPAGKASGEEAIAAAESEYAENGELSPETYVKLADSGFTPKMVNDYIAGRQAIADATAQKVYGQTDGEENYNAMIEWAAENLSESEIDAFNVQLDNAATQEHAVKTLFTRYQSEADVDPDLLDGGSGANVASGDFFKSSLEMQAAMNSKEYKAGDPATHKDVQRKIANAMKQGVKLFG